MVYLQIMQDGGPVMYVIGACCLIAAFIFVEKWYQFHRAQVKVGELVAGLVNVLKRDGMMEAITLCDETPGPVARILTSAIHAYQSGDNIKQAIENQALVEVPRLESRLNILATIAFIAPLLGLLGTIIGIMEAFRVMNEAQGMTLQMLSSGVYKALICTAGGLCAAIPCHIAYNYFTSRVEYFYREMEKASSEIIYFFEHHKRGLSGDED